MTMTTPKTMFITAVKRHAEALAKLLSVLFGLKIEQVLTPLFRLKLIFLKKKKMIPCKLNLNTKHGIKTSISPGPNLLTSCQTQQ